MTDAIVAKQRKGAEGLPRALGAAPISASVIWSLTTVRQMCHLALKTDRFMLHLRYTN